MFSVLRADAATVINRRLHKIQETPISHFNVKIMSYHDIKSFYKILLLMQNNKKNGYFFQKQALNFKIKSRYR